ncbi:hypothetical protein GWK91_16410 [Virgibacillus sp. MSP4-1]|uniref:TasA family protein n=1 Tax=Virgibacillus sp. MSP4-1 TaxID=2700081 RepID=UPI0003A6D833|nr:TasA family protein [Virgibacillus sp. MSP4-1]QHS24362.1 hypothetical protein GWK91_16410 [Virgibacillus sp. MSP4-1]
MSIRKKMTMGALSATMGLSLIAGGTFAAVNDVERQEAALGAGELDLELKKYGETQMNFKLGNLKPGDYSKVRVDLQNHGTLAIKDVLMGMDNLNFDDWGYSMDGETPYRDVSEAPEGTDSDVFGPNTAMEYLDQFAITAAIVGYEEGGTYDKNIVAENISLADFYKATSLEYTGSDKQDAIDTVASSVNGLSYVKDGNAEGVNGMNVSTIDENEWYGVTVNPNDHDVLELTIEYISSEEKGHNENGDLYIQNRFNGDSADFDLVFEARQWGGQEVTEDDIGDGVEGNGEDGYVETNERANNGDAYGEEGDVEGPR